MKIAYIAAMRMPTERAHGIQIMKTCESFAKSGVDVVLYYSWRRQVTSMRGVEPFSYYGLNRRFILKRVLAIDPAQFHRVRPRVLLGIVYVIANVLFGLTSAIRATLTGADIYYTRHWLTAWWLTFFRRPTILEVHQTGTRHASQRASNAVANLSRRRSLLRIVTVSEGLKSDLIARGASGKQIIVAPDAVDVEQLQNRESRDSARAKCGLPQGSCIAVYTGQLFESKGATVLVESALEAPNVTFVLVGGTDSDQKRLTNLCEATGTRNVRIIGRVPPTQVATYQRAADILLLPQVDEASQSPMKLYEYMAAARAIIASDLPAIREVLTDGEDSILVPPGDPIRLGYEVRALAANEANLSRLGRAAFDNLGEWTWDLRASKILDGLTC